MTLPCPVRQRTDAIAYEGHSIGGVGCEPWSAAHHLRSGGIPVPPARRTPFGLTGGSSLLNPRAPAAPELTLSTLSDDLTSEVNSIADGIAGGASSYVVDLWIDLVSQAASNQPTARLPSVTGLSRQQFRALNCLQSEPLTMRALAQRLGISAAAATTTADRLIRSGAAVRFRDTLDRRLVRVVTTVAGVQMASAYRTAQLATLEMLLGRLEPARRVVLALAMKELASGMDSALSAPTDHVLTPEHKQSTLN